MAAGRPLANERHRQRQQTMKTALVTGITGQDGSYLAVFLLD